MDFDPIFSCIDCCLYCWIHAELWRTNNSSSRLLPESGRVCTWASLVRLKEPWQFRRVIWLLAKYGSTSHCCLVAESCQTFFATNCSPPSSSVHEISQTRILEWVVISFSRGSSQPRNWTQVSSTGRQILYCWATRDELVNSYLGVPATQDSWNSSPSKIPANKGFAHSLARGPWGLCPTLPTWHPLWLIGVQALLIRLTLLTLLFVHFFLLPLKILQ